MTTGRLSTAGILTRAKVAAWIVFISMAGTTMAFQVYHSIRYGHMPWPLAVLFGVVPLLIAMCLLEFTAEWRAAPLWAEVAAYLIMGGAMFLSAASTGDVVVRAAPAHMSGLFGVLLDGAALLAAHFLLNGPRKAAEELAAQAEAEAARLAADAERKAAIERAEADERTALRAELGKVRESLRAAEDDLAGTAADLEAATAKAETLTRKLEAATARKRRAATGRKRDASTARKPGPVTGSHADPEEELDEAPSDLDSEAKVLWYLDKGYSASRAGIRAGLTDSRGRQIARIRKAAPTDTVDGAVRPAGDENHA